MNFQRNPSINPAKLASLRQEKEPGFQKVKKYRIDEEDSEEFIDQVGFISDGERSDDKKQAEVVSESSSGAESSDDDDDEEEEEDKEEEKEQEEEPAPEVVEPAQAEQEKDDDEDDDKDKEEESPDKAAPKSTLNKKQKMEQQLAKLKAQFADQSLTDSEINRRIDDEMRKLRILEFQIENIEKTIAKQQKILKCRNKYKRRHYKLEKKFRFQIIKNSQ